MFFFWRYAAQQRQANPPPASAPGWTDVDVPELKAFLGLYLLMGILTLPCRYDYWRRSRWLLRTSFNSVMARDRFSSIWRYLHIENNQGERANTGKLWKLRWLLDQLKSRFQTAMTLSANVAIDESMIKFKGRLGFRQYMPAKPIKWGIKVWALCDSTTGYMWNFQVYCGREEGAPAEVGLAHRVVMDLARPLRGSWVTIYMDNFYTSVPLLRELHSFHMHGCGTVRANRKYLPEALRPKNVRLQKHEFKVAQKNELVCAVWKDTRVVIMLSNVHKPEATGTVRRRVDNVRQNVRVPLCLSDYQQHMNGVDLCDQMIGYYQPDLRSKKWWRRLFTYVLSVSTYNSFILAKQSHPQVVAQRFGGYQDFLELLAEGLIGDYRAGREAPVAPAPLRRTNHAFDKIYGKRKSCRECSATKRAGGKRARQTNHGCVTCQEPVCTTCQGAHIQRHNH